MPKDSRKYSKVRPNLVLIGNMMFLKLSNYKEFKQVVAIERDMMYKIGILKKLI